MTARTIPFKQETASDDTNYLKAISILEEAPFSNDPIHGLDGILDFTEKAVREVTTDMDFWDNRHEASLYALQWSFENLYQKGVPLEEKQFFNLCGDLVIPNETTSPENPTPWYTKY